MSGKNLYGSAALLFVGFGLSACAIPTHDTIPSARVDAPLGACSSSAPPEPAATSFVAAAAVHTAPVDAPLARFFRSPSHRLSIGPVGNDTSPMAVRAAAASPAGSSAVASPAALAAVLAPQIDQATFDRRAAEGKYPADLIDDKVVRTAMGAIAARKLNAFRSAVAQSPDSAVMSLLDGQARVALGPANASTVKVAMTQAIDQVAESHKPGQLTFDDFKAFYEKTLSPKARERISRVGYYQAYYFSGSFVDRFGGKSPSPSFSLTVSNEDIAGSITALLESIADEIFPNTPVWVSLKNPQKPVFYPGKNENMPSALAFLARHGKPEDAVKQAEPIVPRDPDDSTKPMCGMTELKAQALMYLAGTASVWAKGQSGLVLGLLGGTNIGLPIVLGKISLGDNHTLQTIVQTVLAFAARRATYEATWPLLYQLDESKYSALTDMLGVIRVERKDSK
jgi:hypothetical protein